MSHRPILRTSLVGLVALLLLMPDSSRAASCSLVGGIGGGARRTPVRAACRGGQRLEGARLSEAVATPRVEGPITGGNGVPIVQATSFDLAEVGYQAEEYFVSGIADAYVDAAPLGSDGRWTVAPGERAEYRTRIVVHRTIDPGDFNGVVLVEWLNVSGGLDAAPDWTMLHTEITRSGFVWVGVSAQIVGVEGRPGGGIVPGLDLSLKGGDPERYGSLVHPGDSFSYSMYSQVGAALRRPTEVDPLRGLVPERVLAVGESQSAFRLMTYVNALAPRDGVYDAYLIHSRGRGGAPLSQEPLAQIDAPETLRVRTDLEVPVLMLQTETDLFRLGSLPSNQPDSVGFRLWEVAGTAHADTYTLMVGFTDKGDDPSVADVVVTSAPIPGIIECDQPINSGPQHFVLKAALVGLDRWARTGIPPRRAPRLEVAGDPPEFVLDKYGNVRGGIRTSWVAAPVAKLSGLGQTGANFCGIFGTTELFDEATLDELYPDHETYVRRVAASNALAQRRGFLLAPDAELINAAAEASSIGR